MCVLIPLALKSIGAEVIENILVTEGTSHILCMGGKGGVG